MYRTEAANLYCCVVVFLVFPREFCGLVMASSPCRSPSARAPLNTNACARYVENVARLSDGLARRQAVTPSLALQRVLGKLSHMSQVYVVEGDGKSELMERILCKDEDRELQRLLQHNFDLLPDDQIDPDDPRRWLLVKREMPVPDPSTGADRWSIDFLFVDQDAMPTFVECKRCADTRARREIVGQMLEYAANGHHYWTREQLVQLAEQTARDRNQTLDGMLTALRPTDDLSADEFFERVHENLRQGRLRVVFFLERSPFELRSVVDFLNKQMERSEVLLVEARQYQANGMRVIAPTLFGYTEQARQVKRATSGERKTRRGWDKDSFLADAGARSLDGHRRKGDHSRAQRSDCGRLPEHSEFQSSI